MKKLSIILIVCLMFGLSLEVSSLTLNVFGDSKSADITSEEQTAEAPSSDKTILAKSGYRQWGNNTQQRGAQTFAANSKLGDLPIGTTINLPVEENGAMYAVPFFILTRDYSGYGSGTVLRAVQPVARFHYITGNTEYDLGGYYWEAGKTYADSYLRN